MEYAYVKRIRDLREDHDMSQRQVAKILGTSPCAGFTTSAPTIFWG